MGIGRIVMWPHRTWYRTVLIVMATLASLGLLLLSPAVVMLGLLAASAAAMARIARGWQRDGDPKTGRDTWADAWRPAALGFLGVLVLHGLRALLGSAALPIGAAGAIIALVAFVVPGRAHGAPGENAAEAPAPIPRMPTAAPDEPASPGRGPHGSPPVPVLPTPDLCWEWRRSYLAVVRASKPDELTRIAALRATYLDELERRDPTGFRRWLDSGARAASDPGRYLTSG
jgi:hypothetical protein